VGNVGALNKSTLKNLRIQKLQISFALFTKIQIFKISYFNLRLNFKLSKSHESPKTIKKCRIKIFEGFQKKAIFMKKKSFHPNIQKS
jgi:hypothetical protein